MRCSLRRMIRIASSWQRCTAGPWIIQRTGTKWISGACQSRSSNSNLTGTWQKKIPTDLQITTSRITHLVIYRGITLEDMHDVLPQHQGNTEVQSIFKVLDLLVRCQQQTDDMDRFPIGLSPQRQSLCRRDEC
ncbi:hypothetical protein JVT61DRAFT_10881 [Boletus reticuloceps]|uniref:Uncharacterized protein n=1 Tax=Boletus reticuloceps TaxID=495285 RepID=A0A8I2YFA7_9AGAM|nr:hypothetical protein JVT61DRAFT_10881 [Boletus reticuloceps]